MVTLSDPSARLRAVVTADQVRAVALGLPRAYEAWVRDRAKFRVGRLVFLSISPDERSIGFGYPKDARASLVGAEPEKFFLPSKGGHALPLGPRLAGRTGRGRDA
jgi:hypothetical protein